MNPATLRPVRVFLAAIGIVACDWLPSISPATSSSDYGLETRELFCGELHRTSRTRSDRFDAWSCLPGVDASGTERVFVFDAPSSADVVVSVTDHSWYPMVTVTPGSGRVDPTQCIAGNYYSVRFSAIEGERYYITVDSDGTHDDVKFDISLLCDAPTSETDACENGLDDDADFAVDCQDEDCFSACGIIGECAAATVAACGETRFAESTALTGASDLLAHYACPAIDDLEAPEQVYSFTAAADGEVLISLSDYTAYPVITVLEETGAGCFPGDCLTQNFYNVLFSAQAGHTYYAVIESWTDHSFDYDVSWICDPPDLETGLCDDNIDNDGDLLWDCEDDDCFTDLACPVGGACVSVATVECNSVTPGNTAGLGATDEIGLYSCDTEWTLGGNELAYQFVAPRRTKVRISAATPTDYPVLAVLGGNDCDASSCLAMNYYSTDFLAYRDETYFFVVESGGLGPLSFDLHVVCGARDGPERRCDNGLDDDGDTFVDCGDSDCADRPACEGR